MLKPTDKVKVINRSNGTVLYKIPDQKIRQEFNPRQSKQIALEELMTVAQQPGGPELLYNYLYFPDKNVLNYVLGIKNPEVEYNLTEENLPDWLNSCGIDEFKDALDFAPEGIKDLIKQMSVKLPLTDTRKIAAFKDQLGFDCARAIQNEKDTVEDGIDTGTLEKRRRVVQEPVSAPPKYRRVDKGE